MTLGIRKQQSAYVILFNTVFQNPPTWLKYFILHLHVPELYIRKYFKVGHPLKTTAQHLSSQVGLIVPVPRVASSWLPDLPTQKVGTWDLEAIEAQQNGKNHVWITKNAMKWKCCSYLYMSCLMFFLLGVESGKEEFRDNLWSLDVCLPVSYPFGTWCLAIGARTPRYQWKTLRSCWSEATLNTPTFKPTTAQSLFDVYGFMDIEYNIKKNRCLPCLACFWNQFLVSRTRCFHRSTVAFENLQILRVASLDACSHPVGELLW